MSGKITGDGPEGLKIAYIMSRFPRITETFVLQEILELKDQGFEVGIYPLLLERARVEHPEVREVQGAVRHHPAVSLPVLKANWHYLVRRPRTYLKLLARIAARTWRSPNFFFGGLAIFPKSVRYAYEMEREGIEWVHAHFANHPAMAATIIHELTAIPFSFTAHGSDIHVDQTAFDMKAEAADFVVMVSRYNMEFLLGRFDRSLESKMVVVRCGIDPETFAMAPPGRREGPLGILCVASFREVKGHRYLIEACRILRERGVDFRCHLVGGGPILGRVRRQVADLGLEDRCVFHGPLPRPQVAERMREADVVALTSIEDRDGRREGIPVTLMEAMACGLPVVSSRLSGIPELVEDGRTGILTPPGDSRAIADALEGLQGDPDLRARLGREGRRKVLEEYDLKTNAARLGDLFRRRAGPHREGGGNGEGRKPEAGLAAAASTVSS